MESHEDNLHLRPFQAVVWHADPESVGIRTTYFATDCIEARKLAIAEHGEDCTFSIWNEEDAERPRQNQNSKQVGDGDAEEAV